MNELTMTISGRVAPSAAFYPVEDPATNAVLAEAPECSPEQMDEAMQAAAGAQRGWESDRKLRQSTLEQLASAVEGRLEDLAEVITSEEGKPLSEARSEVGDAVNDLRYFASLELADETVREDEHTVVRVVRRPIGPVAAITPWNFPLGTAVAKIAPALAAGCTVVLKPSPYTPLACLLFGEIGRGIVPPGVLNVLSGGNELGMLMTEHSVPRMVSFTGSVSTGKKIATAVAPDLKRLTLELGGNDPAIVLDDFDLEQTADGLFSNAFGNCGQICVAIKRVYVPRRRHDELVSALVARAEAAKVGDGHLAGTDIGPLCNKMQYERVDELVRDATNSGGEVVTGGHRVEGPGYFFEPTVVVGLTDGARLVDEEQFGPALPIVSYDDVDDAIERANASHFGLGASIWTTDPERGAGIARGVESGTVWVNTHQAGVPGQPFGGLKWSGIGVEGGRWGMIGFTELQAIHVARG
ncbi:MAG: Aldehyde Dehydrogenase [Acidimicrobiaceae bacterium]|nr:Aldehyde Dehydrogenase [Acidimicrobiaceae bacterium]